MFHFRSAPWRGRRRVPLAVALAAAFPAMTALAAEPTPPLLLAHHDDTPPEERPVKSLGVVTVTGGAQPTALPTQIPTTMETVTRAQIERTVNASDAEDALKYFPSLLVRKRYIGDYNHAILSSRASGTGNSARSAVYADGILLSNYLGNGVGGLSFPPRWAMVAPEEIDRVDVMYGPFSAAYPGNSVGAVVVYTTRMPKAFEAHARVGYTTQPFSLYGTDTTFHAWETSASLGNKAGDLSWRLGFEHTDSHGQPLTFATRTRGTTPTGATPVTGAVPDTNTTGQPIYVLGTGTEYRSKQDQFKLRLAYDITPVLRANYLLGVWRNRAQADAQSYLRDGAGQPVYGGTVALDPTTVATLAPGDFAQTDEQSLHVMHGLSLKSHTQGEWDGSFDASTYDYRVDRKRQSGTLLPAAANGGAGTLADGGGSGWINLAAKGIWRPQGLDGAHIVEAGVQQDRYTLRFPTYAVADDWRSGDPSAVNSDVGGTTSLLSAYLQDAWRFAPDWKTVLGLRAERWRASGFTTIKGQPTVAGGYPDRQESHLSPKAALSWQAAEDLVLKASVGRAVRFPTVAELYGATATTNSQFINDPNLRPERSVTTELSAERDFGTANVRVTLFGESTRDALYTQLTFDPAANANVSRVQNVGRIRTRGIELVGGASDVLMKGLDLNGSVTYTDSKIVENAGFVAAPGDTLGKRQPNIPAWRASAIANWRIDERFNVALGARYSGRQYRTLNNADVNGFTYTGVSRYFTTDLRVRWQVGRQWSAAFGVDNLNNDKYWNFHPYPQRSYSAELRYDL